MRLRPLCEACGQDPGEVTTNLTLYRQTAQGANWLDPTLVLDRIPLKVYCLKHSDRYLSAVFRMWGISPVHVDSGPAFHCRCARCSKQINAHLFWNLLAETTDGADDRHPYMQLAAPVCDRCASEVRGGIEAALDPA